MARVQLKNVEKTFNKNKVLKGINVEVPDGSFMVMVGPSGCGKDTVVKTMREKHPEIEVSVSATSRAMREGEAEGVNYYYMTREEFQQKVQAGEILEYTQYNGNLYGTPKHEVDTRIAQGRTVILVIEVEGAGNIRKLYPEALTIFLLPPSMEELENRLRSRGTETEEAIQGRMATARREVEQAPLYTATLVNDDLETCAEKLYQMIQEYQKG